MFAKFKEVKAVCSRTLKIPGIKSKYQYLHFTNLARKNGVVPFRWDRIATEYLHDYIADTGVPRNEKEWFYQRGYPSFKVKWLGLTKENVNNYLSDFDFYNCDNYVNTQFENWFEHKLNTYYLLAPFNSSMPKHYYYAHAGVIEPLDVETKGAVDAKEIIDLVKTNPIAVKACVGGHGRGFYKLEYVSDGTKETFYANNEAISEENLVNLINNLHDNIITEYAIPHTSLRRLCGENSFAVIRTVSVYDENNGGKITGIIIRLGCKEAGVVTDYDSTIYCGVDLEDRHLFSPIIRSGYSEDVLKRTDIKVHPDTQEIIDGFVIPNFEELKSLVLSVSNYLPVTPYLVMDIIPTDNGFKILEINSHGQVRIIEPFYPFRKNEANCKVIHCIDR